MNTNTNMKPKWAQEARDMYTYLTEYSVCKRFETALAECDVDAGPVQFVAAFCDPLIVSRHPAAVEFIKAKWPMIADAPVVTGNVTRDDVRGRVVIGNVPMAIAAEAVAAVAVEFDGAPPRGQEYSAADMVAAGARLRLYRVECPELFPSRERIDEHHRWLDAIRQRQGEVKNMFGE
jgi:hypothetical protein